MSESAISPKSCPKCGAILPSAATAGLCPRCLMAEAMVPSDPGAEPAEAKKMFAPAELAPYFPQLEILECLGRGGMGVVYKARQKSLNRLVALKLLAPERVNDAGFAGRFQTEAQALAKLNHPDIVTVYDFGQAGGLYFLLMEFVDGMNLRQLLNAGRIAPREALAIVPQICDALQYAHDAGIVHRDIKPENILLDRQGRVKVADFGLAKLVGTVEPPAAGVASPQSETTKAGQVMGTPQYMAPEQRDHPSDVDHRADIYSLGVVFYQMLTGELPGKQLEPPSSRMRGIVIDVRLDEVVLRALEKQPDRRYQQASEVKTIVETIATTPVSVGTAVPPSLKSEPAISYAGFWRRAWALVIDLAIVSCVAFLVLLALASYAPDRVVVSSPVGKFTTERIIETKQVPRQNPDGSTTVVEERIVEVTNLGRWKYFYRDKVEHSGGDEKKSRQLIDPVTRQDRQAWTLDMLSMNLLLVYLILLESSPLQGSVGKRLLGIKVVTEQGQRVTLARAVGRNFGKLLSIFTFLTGFMMAGWTKQKQALHDILAKCYVVYGKVPGDRHSVGGWVRVVLLGLAIAILAGWQFVHSHEASTSISVGATNAPTVRFSVQREGSTSILIGVTNAPAIPSQSPGGER